MQIITPSLRRLGVIVASLTLTLPMASLLSANDRLAPQPLADSKAPALPVATSFEKSTPGEHGGAYSLVVKNTSTAALKLNATIRWSVVSHATARTIELPPRELGAGETWAISDLSVEDRVTLSAEGFETLEVKVPAAK